MSQRFDETDPIWKALDNSCPARPSSDFVERVAAESLRAPQASRDVVSFPWVRSAAGLAAAFVIALGAGQFFAEQKQPELTAQEVLDLELINLAADNPDAMTDEEVLSLLF